MIYTKTQKDSIIYQSQIWLSELGETLTNLEESMQPCGDLYCQGYGVRTLMLVIQRNTEKVASTPPEEGIEVGLKQWQLENIYNCLVATTDIKDYPAFTPLTAIKPPAVIIGQPGPQGPAGIDGKEGTDAYIDCISEDDGITIETRDVAGVKTFVWTHTPYIEPAISLNLDPSAVIEIGNVLSVNVNINLTKGRDDVTASVITSNTALDASYQTILDLPGLNAGGPSGRTIIASGVQATTVYTVDISDEIPSVVKNIASRTLNFVYPFFDGATIADTINPYSDLVKRIVTKSNKSVAYNDTDRYFWFCYPASYGDLSSIKDQNGFEVISSFTKIVQNVTSTGLVNNWTESYHLYRTTYITDIINGTFTFNF